MAQAHEKVLTGDEAAPTPASAQVLLRNIGYLAGSQVTTWVASLLYTIIVTRAIGPRNNGELTAAMALTGILATGVGFGLGTYLVKEVATRPSRAPRLVGNALLFQLLVLPLAALAMAAYLTVEQFSREMTIVFILFGLGLPATVCSQTLQAALGGIQRMGVVAASGAITAVLYDAIAITLVLLGQRNVILLSVLVLATICLSLVITVVVYRRHLTIDLRIRLGELRGVVRGGFPFLAAQVAYTLYVAADTLILATLSTSTEVGWYGAVNRLFASLLVVSTIISAAWLPRLAAHAHRDPAALGRETRLMVRFALLSAVPLAVGGSLVAGPLVTTIWGPAYAGASDALRVILLSLPATSICTVLYQVLVARGHAGRWAWVMAIALALNVAANTALVLLFRSAGGNTALAAALCLNVTEAGMAVVALWMNRSWLGRPMLWYAARTLAAAILMGAAVELARGLPLALVIALGGLVFCVLALAFRLVSREELTAGALVIRRVARR